MMNPTKQLLLSFSCVALFRVLNAIELFVARLSLLTFAGKQQTNNVIQYKCATQVKLQQHYFVWLIKYSLCFTAVIKPQITIKEIGGILRHGKVFGAYRKCYRSALAQRGFYRNFFAKF